MEFLPHHYNILILLMDGCNQPQHIMTLSGYYLKVHREREAGRLYAKKNLS